MMLYRLVTSRVTGQHVVHRVISLSGVGHLGQKLREQGIDVDSLQLNTIRGKLASLCRIRSTLRQFDPDCIQGWMPHGNIMATVARAIAARRARLFWNVRQSIYDLRRESFGTRSVIRFLARLSPLAHGIVYNSQVGAQQHEAIGYDRRRTLVIPNGFDTDVWSPSGADRAAIRVELGLAPDAILIGMIARFDPLKDHRSFLEAFSRVSPRFPAARALLVGRGLDASNPKLAEWISQYGLGTRVILLGERRDVSRINAALDVACLSSVSEGFPNSIGEAMACAVPCVVTDVGEAGVLVGSTGQVVEPGNAVALSEGLSRLLSLSLRERQNLGLLARERILQRYSIAGVARMYGEMYGC